MSKLKKIKINGLFILPLAFVYLELILRITTGFEATYMYAGSLLMAVALGMLLNIFAFCTKNKKTNRIIAFVLLELITVMFCVFYFTNNSYQVFMSPDSIFAGVGDVANNFKGEIVSTIKNGIGTILLFHVPTILFAVFWKNILYTNKKYIKCAACLVLAAIIAVIAYFCCNATEDAMNKFTYEYSFDSAVRHFGLTTALGLDTVYRVKGIPEAEISFEDVPDYPDEEPEYNDDPGTPEPEIEEPKVIEYNKLDIDWESLIANEKNSSIKAAHQYVSSVPASEKNDYTGLFRGKNLILITAEAFTKEVIDPERTPTLYRLANKGIVFEDFYQPAWGGSTSTGETSLLSGIVPINGVKSIRQLATHDLSFTIGNQLKNADPSYYTAAYHNGLYDYYNRNTTHKQFGYDIWMGRGNGMEEGTTNCWPESDLEMFQFTVPQYINEDKFSVYYMTVSGHCGYSWGGNAMSRKNKDMYADLGFSDTIAAYYACNQELEYAMEYLVTALEEAGKADDTVIVMTADHYPYGLENSAAWGTDKDYVSELYGYKVKNIRDRDHNACIIWSGCLEDNDPIVISEPCYSLDVLPTLCNLFGVEYDSRLLVGRDVLAPNTEALVLWANYSWATSKGFYNASSGTFTPADVIMYDEQGQKYTLPGDPVSDEYISRIKNIVKNKINYSKTVLNNDYFKTLSLNQ